MKKIIIIVLLVVVISIIINFTLNKKIIDNNSNIEVRIIVKIEDIEYNVNKYYQLKDKKKDKGYVVYSSGQVVKYDNIKNEKSIAKTIGQDRINTILDLANKIDESKISTINTEVAVSAGKIITVYNNENKTVLIKDFYSINYSDEANAIIKILKEENIL